MTWTARDDDAIRAWLHDAAPDGAPSTVLEATFARTRGRSRRRVRPRWREPRLALLLAAALAFVAVAGGAVLVALSRPSEPLPAVTLPQPRYLGDFLWSGGYALEIDVVPSGAVPADQVAATAAGPDMAPYLGPPDPPIFGRLRCAEPGLCGNPAAWAVPPDAGTGDTWSVWIVEYPQEEAFRVVSAWDGRMLTGWDGDDLQSCSAEEVGTEPFCTADSLLPPRTLPAEVRAALAYWGQTFGSIDNEYTTLRNDNSPYWPADAVDPLAVAATLVDEPRVVDAFQLVLGCQRANCPDGIALGPTDERMVAIVVVDEGARWVILDAATGELLASDETPIVP